MASSESAEEDLCNFLMFQGMTNDGGFVVSFEDAAVIRGLLPTGTDINMRR